MFQTQSKNSLKMALLVGAATATALSMTGAAQAVETVIVTGSRIPQPGLVSASPLTTVSSDLIQQSGTVRIEDLLNQLPSVFADQGSTQSNGASGTANVNLRGLGSTRTLVLIDGKRLMPSDAASPVADLNQIPAALVDHVEVVTGGASAVYGSDALAGVVNFIMRKDFEGVEIDGTLASAWHDNNSIIRSLQDQSCAPTTPVCGGVLFSPVTLAPRTVFDGTLGDATFLMGVNAPNGKGNLTLYAGYRSAQPILESTRDFSACALATNTSGTIFPWFNCSGSSTRPDGRFTSLDLGFDNRAWVTTRLANAYAAGSGAVGPTNAVSTYLGPPLLQKYNKTSFKATTTSGTTGGGGLPTGQFANNSGFYNFAPFNYLQRPDQRYTFGASGHYELNNNFDIYASLSFMDDHTVAQIAPSGTFQHPFTVNCGATGLIGFLPDTSRNPFLSQAEWSQVCNFGNFEAVPVPTVLNSPGNATMLIGRRSVESGNRQDDLRHTSYRIVIGSKGELSDSWTYDLFAQYGETIYAENYLNEWSLTRTQKALQVVADPRPGAFFGQPVCKSVLDGSDPSCVPLNIFQAPTLDSAGNVVSSPLFAPIEGRSQLAYVQGQGLKQGTTVEQIISGSITGDLGEMGGQSPWAVSPIALAIGAEYRQESLALQPDFEFTSGDLAGQGGPTPAVHGQFNVGEGFLEVRAPLIEDKEGAKLLQFAGGYRISRYSNAGVTHTYKAALEWMPTEDLRVRGSYQRAVRAPNTVELFTPSFIGLFGGQDVCANNTNTNAPPSASHDAFCRNQPGLGAVWHTGGVGDKYGTILPCPASQCNALFSGNVALNPEIGDTFSAGVVLTPTFLEGFSATIDYFDVNIEGLIGRLGSLNTLNACGNTGAAAYCARIHRDPVTGFLWSNDSAFVINTNLNTGATRTSGVDVGANYASSLDDFWLEGYGGMALDFKGTLLRSLKVTPGSGIFAVGSYECASLFGTQCGTPNPKWRHRFAATWESPWDFNITAAWRFTDSVRLDQNTTQPLLTGTFDPNDDKINAYNYLDLTGSWNVTDYFTLRGGVNNVFDTDPPLIDSVNIGVSSPPFGNGNTFPGVYDSLGRLLFVGGTVKL